MAKTIEKTVEDRKEKLLADAISDIEKYCL